MLGATAAIIGAPLVTGRSDAATYPSRHYSPQATEIIRRTLVIDMLAPISMQQEQYRRWSQSPQGMTEAEFEVFLRSGINVFHHSIGLGGPSAFTDALTYVADLNGFIARYSDRFQRIGSVADLRRLNRQRKIGVIIGIQNSEHFRTPEDVDLFYSLGQRVSQLTYNSQNYVGSGSTERIDGGLSDFGLAIVARMNQVGMLIDASHCGDRTTLDAIEASTKPIAITHTNSRALNNHPRLKTDEAVKRLAAKGGVVGVTGVRMFVRDREPTTVEHIVDHIDHFTRLVGPEYVGLGTDADLSGNDQLGADVIAAMRRAYKSSYGFREKLDTDGYDHPCRMFGLTEALIRRGYSDDHIAGFLGANFNRLLTTVWS